MGVPVIGCDCAVCSSPDQHDKRLRTSALLEIRGLNILFDAGPDLRQQALHVGLRRVDAVLLTHAHADHIAGLDDLRPLNFVQRAAIPLYGSAPTLQLVRKHYDYAFAEKSDGSTRPALELCQIDDAVAFQIGPVTVLPFEVLHGAWSITGFRIGSLGYVTDASAIPAASRAWLRNLDLLVLNALRPRPHPTHFSLGQALEQIEELKPRRALLVHMTHDLAHAATNASLPDHVRLAYDGQAVEIVDNEYAVV